MKITPDTTVKEILVHEIEAGFFYLLSEQIEAARANFHAEVRGVYMFNEDAKPLLKGVLSISNGGSSYAIPKELEPEWLSKIDAILAEVHLHAKEQDQ